MSAESCCQPQPAVKSPCPACGSEGKAVAERTLDRWVLPEFRGRLGGGPAWICISPGCPVIYFSPDGQRVGRHEVIARVGDKTGEGPTPVCYCFGHTREAIESELRVTGDCRVPSLITAEIKAGRCACETKNPEGRCCLGRVNAAVNEAKKKLAAQGLLGPGGLAPAICDDTGCAI